MRLSPTQPTSSNADQVEVCEVFWYGCPHCFDFDPHLKAWVETKPENVSFIRVPAVWNPLLQLHARAFYTAEALGKGAEMHDEFFREIHERGNMLDSEEKLAEFFGRFNVDAAAFKTAFDSFEVHAKLQRADELSRRYRIQSVPTIVVNGKYTTGGGEVGSWQDLLALVDELVVAEGTGR
jgi:thiol:disulfide interchange protein DsbA